MKAGGIEAYERLNAGNIEAEQERYGVHPGDEPATLLFYRDMKGDFPIFPFRGKSFVFEEHPKPSRVPKGCEFCGCGDPACCPCLCDV